jgi:transposase InsO family protein
VSERREIVSKLVEKGVSERMACEVVGLNRSTYRYKGYGLEGSEELKARIMELASKHRRYGYRRITAVLRRSERVNHKRVWRLWKSEGLSLPRRRPKKRHSGQRRVLPTRAEYRGHVWTLDFVYDRTETNRVLKMLVVLDEYTRECHRIRVGYSLDSQAVIDTLGELFETYGEPKHLRSDNGGEFIAARVKAWLVTAETATIHIEPGHPWENGYCESFNGKLRDECLNEEVFYNARYAQAVIETWRQAYNTQRPHSSLGYRTPAEVARDSVVVVGGPGLEAAELTSQMDQF